MVAVVAVARMVGVAVAVAVAVAVVVVLLQMRLLNPGTHTTRMITAMASTTKTKTMMRMVQWGQRCSSKGCMGLLGDEWSAHLVRSSKNIVKKHRESIIH